MASEFVSQFDVDSLRVHWEWKQYEYVEMLCCYMWDTFVYYLLVWAFHDQTSLFHSELLHSWSDWWDQFFSFYFLMHSYLFFFFSKHWLSFCLNWSRVSRIFVIQVMKQFQRNWKWDFGDNACLVEGWAGLYSLLFYMKHLLY